ncbi:MAG: glycosyltransferase [Bacteroidales bacterium]|jgi:glycosyltransferase involved in cell wall biosynthesis|nr:glycosyltransferase [Bacteroidales bacterium]
MKRIIISITNDLYSDRRVLKVAHSCFSNGYEVRVIGRKNRSSKTLNLPFQYRLLPLCFQRSALFFAEFNIKLFFILLFSKVDILLANDTDTLVANYLVSKLRRKKLVFDAHEIYPELPELSHRPKIKRIWEIIEDWIFPNLKFCYTVCQSISDYYSKKYDITMKVVRNIPQRLTYKGEKLLDYSGKKIILYQGAINIGRGLEWIIDAMPLVNNAVFVIIGDGLIINELIERVKQQQLQEKVFFLGRISGSELYKYTPSADLGVCLLKNRGLNYYYSLPNRIFDYLNAGVPVLATDFPEISNIVNKHKTGILINRYEPEYLAKVLNGFFTSEFDTSRFAEISQMFCWENEEKGVLELLARSQN